MVNSYPSQPIEKIRKSGDPLDFVWFGNADEKLKNQYRDAKGEGPTKALRMQMEADVRAELADGSLIATGYRTQPDLSEQPEIIPSFMFASQTVIINWDKSEIAGLGRRFETVTVTRFHPSANENEPTEPVRAEPAKRGPKRLDALFAETVASLKTEHDQFSDWMLEKQISEIREKVPELYPGRFPQGSKPGRTTVWRYLKKFPLS